MQEHGYSKHTSQIQHEIQALYSFYRATGGESHDPKSHATASTSTRRSASAWHKQTGWPALVDAVRATIPESYFARAPMDVLFPLHGVVWERNHVVAIDLSDNGLRGSIPEAIGHLQFLQKLKLRNNPRLGGELPQELYRMPHLRYCYVDGTKVVNALPFRDAHALQITQLRSLDVTVSFHTGKHPHQCTQWIANLPVSSLEMIHSALAARHAKPPPPETSIECTALNATGPERIAAAIKLQRIYRARMERAKIRTFLKSIFEERMDPTTGYEYFVDSRTGISTWERPKLATTPRKSAALIDNNEGDRGSSDSSEIWRQFDDGYGNTYYWNSVTGESTWEPPVFLSRIHQELRARYGADKTDEDRFDLFFQDIDKDQTGEIDRDEFALLCGELGMALSAKQIDHVFRELDTSGDGQLSRQEIMAWLTRNYT